LIQIGYEGMKAIINGGSIQTFMNAEEIILDASSSYDLDYPSNNKNLLSYTWTCQQISAKYNENCNGFSTANSALLRIVFSSAQVIRINVTVNSILGYTDTTSVKLIIVEKVVPIISIDTTTIQKKYNPDTKIILTSYVANAIADVNAIATWSCDHIDSFSTANATNTPLTTYFTYGTYTFQLSIQMNTLTAGKSYNFQLASSYLFDALAMCTVQHQY
jgi:hypothetical protein